MEVITGRAYCLFEACLVVQCQIEKTYPTRTVGVFRMRLMDAVSVYARCFHKLLGTRRT